MKDTYTKIILTVIAICLVALVLSGKNVIPEAHASNQTAQFAVVPLNPDGSINVRLIDAQKEAQEVIIIGWKKKHRVFGEDVNYIQDLEKAPLPVD